MRQIAETSEALAQLLQRELTDGGCAAVVCNTVARAQQTFEELRKLLPQWHDDVQLFHARFVYEDRMAKEAGVLESFGPGHRDEVRPRRILVATQVIEQSLDLDFDLMVSDPAPIDLLLQRSGRLMRHERRRPAGFDGAGPTLYIRWDPSPARGPSFDAGTTYVYAEHILLRTWAALRRHGDSIAIPEDVEDLIEAVYAEGEMPPPTEAAAERWGESWAKREMNVEFDQSKAEVRRVPPPGATFRLEDFTRQQLEEDAPELHAAFRAETRLGGPSVGVVLLRAGDPAATATSPPSMDRTRRLLGRAVNLSAPRWIVDAVTRLEAPAAWRRSSWLSRHRLLVLAGDGTALLGDRRVRYDKEFGLRADGEE